MVTRHGRAVTLERVGVAMLIALAASCDSGPTGPSGPGQLDALLISPNGAEAAAVLQLTGTGIGAIEVEGGNLFRETDGNATRIVVILDEPGNVRFKVHVAERSEPPGVLVLEVADGNNEVRSQLGAYRVEFTPVIDTVPASSMVTR